MPTQVSSEPLHSGVRAGFVPVLPGAPTAPAAGPPEALLTGGELTLHGEGRRRKLAMPLWKRAKEHKCDCRKV